MSDPVTDFQALGLSTPILSALQEVGYEAPSPIQAAAIPPLLAGRDIIGQAQTGTGKTAAFALPLLSRIDLSRREPQVLVLAPTRELAIQVAEAFQRYARHLPGFHVLPVYGGQGMGHQLQQLRRGAHVVVGTPGRVADHLRRETLKLDGLSALVLDEADEMLRMGFIDDVEWIVAQSPETRQVALFSATMPPPIRKVAEQYLREPEEIRIQAKTATVSAVRQRYWPVSGLHKLDALTRILEVEEFDGLIIFVRTKSATEELAEKLEARGYDAGALNGDMNQAQREKNIERLKNGELDIIVATDVAARGLDVSRISHVVNYDIPYDTEAYVHRIGRTGRAGRTGEAILFVSHREQRMLRAIEKATRQPIEPMQLPSREEVSDRRIARFREELDGVLAGEDLDFFQRVVEEFSHDRELSMNEIAAALAFLVQKERPLQLPEIKQERPPRERRERDDRADRFQKGERPARFERGERPERGERFERGDRPERVPRGDTGPDTAERPRRERRREGDEGAVSSLLYRFAVGRNDGVEVKNIVGAIANEAGLDRHYIGRVQLFDDYGTVELPEGMPKEIYRHLQGVFVCGKRLGLSLGGDEGGGGGSPRPRRRPEGDGPKRPRDGERKGRRRPERD